MSQRSVLSPKLLQLAGAVRSLVKGRCAQFPRRCLGDQLYAQVRSRCDCPKEGRARRSGVSNGELRSWPRLHPGLQNAISFNLPGCPSVVFCSPVRYFCQRIDNSVLTYRRTAYVYYLPARTSPFVLKLLSRSPESQPYLVIRPLQFR